jgi:predicted TIM-barrel fold metal-dependent hydrolase
MDSIHNCHTHTFTCRAIPEGFFPFGFIHFLRSKWGSAITRYILRKILPFKGWDAFDRIAAFVTIGNMKSQEENFRFVKGFYPQGTKFVILPMDMEFMGAGSAPQSYLEQLEELKDLYMHPEYRDMMIPFIAVDPRRPRIEELLKEYIDKHNFRGIKLYPPLGYYPFDPALDPVYSFAEEKQIPIIAHCSPGGVYGRYKITPEMRKHPKTGALIEGGSKKFFKNYTDPANYHYVLERFPNLIICLAHFGGGAEWAEYLKNPLPGPESSSWLSKVSRLIQKYPNVYADVAYTASEEEYRSMIKVLINTEELREKILYGSDFYMVQMDNTEREFGINLRAFLGEDDYRQIAVTNPLKFFNHKAERL